MYKIAQVVVDNATIAFDKEFDYYIPLELEQSAMVGCRVTVPFGGYNKRRTGLITSITTKDSREKLKSISTLIDKEPVLNDEMIQIVRFMKDYTFCRYFDAIKAIIPSGIGIKLGVGICVNNNFPLSTLGEKQIEIVSYINKHKSPTPIAKVMAEFSTDHDQKLIQDLISANALCETILDKQKIQDEKSLMVRLTDREQSQDNLTPKQKIVYEMLLEADASVKELCYYCPITRNVIDNMVKKTYIELYEHNTYRNPYKDVKATPNMVVNLTPSQHEAYTTLLELVKNDSSDTALLYGITGSGKTSVFLKLIEDVVKQGKQAIVMVPEIALTPQTVEKFHMLFGERVAVLHSSLTMSQRMDEWKRIKEGMAEIVVGTRSAVFAPLKNIGLIVIDEEQEHTYKSEASPRFHARDIAAMRCKYNNALLLLASATPSIESYHFAKTGKYKLVTLQERFGGIKLPDVYIVDMLGELAHSSTMGMSQRIIDELYINLQTKEQSILLMNRRGYNTAVKCSGCATIIKCPNCDVPLTYHNVNHKVMCHYCSFSAPTIKACPDCGCEMVRYTGVGTQRVEEQLGDLFPNARVLRMDMDTTMSRNSYEDKFSAFLRGEYDIMIGTQMVAKGLNFPNVTMVGVLNPDQMLYGTSFRGYERAFSLITQVVGRSGRGDKPGRAFVQTVNPNNRIISLAADQNYDEYYKEEIIFRKLNLYPPFCKISCVGLVSEDEFLSADGAKKAMELIKSIAKNEYGDLPIRALTPAPAQIYKVAGKYRYNILVKHKQDKKAYQLLNRVLKEYSALSQFKKTSIYIDVNYDG